MANDLKGRVIRLETLRPRSIIANLSTPELQALIAALKTNHLSQGSLASQAMAKLLRMPEAKLFDSSADVEPFTAGTRERAPSVLSKSIHLLLHLDIIARY